MGITPDTLEAIAEAMRELSKELNRKISISTSVEKPTPGSVGIIGRAVYSVGIDSGCSWTSIDGLSNMSLEMIPPVVSTWIKARNYTPLV